MPTIKTQHPAYSEFSADWTLMSDCYAGERVVKERTTTYLPATSGMLKNGMGQTGQSNGAGQKAYDAYVLRAVFPEFVRESVVGMLGVLHRKAPTIDVPDKLQPFVDNATITGESLASLWRSISEAQLLHGRVALLVDIPEGETSDSVMPYVATYAAPTLINWDVGVQRQGRQQLELAVLDETASERKPDLTWETVTRHRILAKTEVAESVTGQSVDAGAGKYVVATAKDGEIDKAFFAPRMEGRTLDEIPLVIINATDLTVAPERPPLLGLSNISMAIYRGEADYRQTLFMQGQDTLLRIGATDEERNKDTGLGAGAVIDVSVGGSASFIGVGATGLSEMRGALENDNARATQYTIQLMDTKGSAESGEALRIRVAAKTASLAAIQLTAAEGVRDVLKLAGKWMGLSEAELDQIVVTPNLDFSNDSEDPVGLNQLIDAKIKGAPISWRSIHQWIVDNEYSVLTYDDELDEIEAEEALPQPSKAPLPGDTGDTGDTGEPGDKEGDEGDEGDEG